MRLLRFFAPHSVQLPLRSMRVLSQLCRAPWSSWTTSFGLHRRTVPCLAPMRCRPPWPRARRLCRRRRCQRRLGRQRAGRCRRRRHGRHLWGRDGLVPDRCPQGVPGCLWRRRRFRRRRPCRCRLHSRSGPRRGAAARRTSATAGRCPASWRRRVTAVAGGRCQARTPSGETSLLAPRWRTTAVSRCGWKCHPCHASCWAWRPRARSRRGFWNDNFIASAAFIVFAIRADAACMPRTARLQSRFPSSCRSLEVA
mmetsp:Transcript_85533/g.222883  ORF Transcript_85533/g.222883 Transcript_85533/m.222883 type:complete len:254 (-) Transcript_85533:576-1337(-)